MCERERERDYMARTSSSTFPIYKVDFPAALSPQGIGRKRLSPPTSFGLSREFLLKHTTSRVSKWEECAVRCRLEKPTTNEDPAKDNSLEVQVKSCMWNWRGYSIRYQYSGDSGPALVLVHGFGANSDHWRKNIPVLACSQRVFSIDLIGYGYSDKPNPRDFGVNSFYTFETWATQLIEFCMDVVKDSAFFVCNSIGGVVGLQAAVMDPDVCRGIFILNISLRMLHIKKQPWYGRPLIRTFQSLLRNTAVGKFFYKSVATPETVRRVLCQVFLYDAMDFYPVFSRNNADVMGGYKGKEA